MTFPQGKISKYDFFSPPWSTYKAEPFCRVYPLDRKYRRCSTAADVVAKSTNSYAVGSQSKRSSPQATRWRQTCWGTRKSMSPEAQDLSMEPNSRSHRLVGEGRLSRCWTFLSFAGFGCFWSPREGSCSSWGYPSSALFSALCPAGNNFKVEARKNWWPCTTVSELNLCCRSKLFHF